MFVTAINKENCQTSCTYQKWELDPGAVELLVRLQSQAEDPAEDALDEVGEDGDVAADGEAAPRGAVDAHDRRLRADVVEDGDGAVRLPAGVHQVEVAPVHHHPLVSLVFINSVVLLNIFTGMR